jgi:hypothetical protein
VLFDAALNGGVLDWKDVIPKMDGHGPLLVIARTDKGYVVVIMIHCVVDCCGCLLDRCLSFFPLLSVFIMTATAWGSASKS